MLWHYNLIFLIIALAFQLKTFDKNTEQIGRIFYHATAGLFWGCLAYGLLSITFKWAGSTNVISYTYIPSWEAWVIVPALGVLGTLNIFLAVYRSMEVSTKPITDNVNF